MHLHTKRALLLPLFFLLFVTGCKTKERLVYFNGKSSSNDTIVKAFKYAISLKPDDILSIVITSEDPEAIIPFNQTVMGSSSQQSGYSTGISFPNGYLIDANGEISMPVIGKIKVGGMDRIAATSAIQTKLREYVSDAIVRLSIENFKITVLGDVKTPGTFKIPNERITILEALGLAGDLKITGNRKIVVIRDNNGTIEQIPIDLTSATTFESEAYYLRQNDVVYVEPNMAARNESTIWKTSGPILISVTSIIVTTIALITK
jgi:polysaccharide export outer membrane protein